MGEILKTDPAVFAVGTEYQIGIPCNEAATVWVEIAGEAYYDDSIGVMRSMSNIHKIAVPREELDNAKEYTVVYRKIIERKAYFSEMEEPVRVVYPFRPVQSETIRAYHIADVHNKPIPAIAAGKFFGDSLDLLILNGDIPTHGDAEENFFDVYTVAGELTHGSIPIVFARGNHDLRGVCAEKFSDYIPLWDGKTYFTFRFGSLWGIVLDCGEDKDESYVSYGGTHVSASYRRKETAYLNEVIRRAEEEYLAPGVERRIVVCHIPFCRTAEEPFNIEIERYTEWCRLLREEIKPDVMLCGHEHILGVFEVGGSHDDKGQPCPLVIGARPYEQEDGSDGFEGAAFTFDAENILVQFSNHNGNVLEEHTLPYRRK